MASSAQRKLLWGVELFKTLRAEVDTYTKRKAYVFDTERDVRTPTEVEFRCFASEKEAPPEHWPLLAGDTIQNIRAALDHCVWAAWRSVKGNTGDGTHTQFVIAEDPKRWKSSHGRLKGVPGRVVDLVERRQPFNHWPREPSHDMLAILARLSNADKHHELAIVASAIQFEMVGVDAPVKIERWKPATGKRLREGRNQISSFAAISREPFDPEEVRPDFTYDLHIEGMRIDVIKGFIHDVFEIVVEAETGSRPSPAARYPI